MGGGEGEMAKRERRKRKEFPCVPRNTYYRFPTLERSIAQLGRKNKYERLKSTGKCSPAQSVPK